MRANEKQFMWNAKKLSVFLILAYAFTTSFCIAGSENTEPNAAELVRAVRESENWIHKVDSFFLCVESKWTNTPKAIAAKRAKLRQRYSDTELDPNRFWDLKPRHEDFFEFAIERDRLYFRREEPGRSRTLKVWDGKEAFSHRQYFISEQNHYYLGFKPEQVFEHLFANISWLRSQPHSFWFDPQDVNECLNHYGYPEDFVVIGQQNYRGVDCYVLDWKPKKGLYPAQDLSKRWYVGVKDRRLYGLATLHGGQVDVEHFTLFYREIAPGCWFPLIHGYDIHDPDEEGKYYLKSHRDLKMISVRVNEKLPEEFFEIELKDGVEVIDERLDQRITYIYKAPLVGKPLPVLSGIKTDFSSHLARGNAVLFCFFDYEQRPSRHCMFQLTKKAEHLTHNHVTVVAVHASKVDENTLNEWTKENNIHFQVGMVEGDVEKTLFTWGVKSFPWLILTDRKHIVKAEGFSINELDERIEEESELAKKPLGPGQHKLQLEKSSPNTLGCKYLLYLPEGYGQKEKKWPMILFLHGAGERGDDLSLVEIHGPPKIVQSKKDFPFVVVSPQCPNGGWWSKQHEVLISLLDEIIQQYDVDESRICLTGLSMGGYGSWSLGCEYPDRFAAIAPICGGGDPFLAGRLKDLPVWAFHGAKDKTVPLEKSELMVEAVNNAGGDVKLTVYPEAGHDSWTETYNNPELYEWFLRHHR